MAEFTIRKFKETDLPALTALIHKTIGACYPGHYCREAIHFFLRYHSEDTILEDARAGCTLVLDRAGRVFGTGTLIGDEIQRLFVDPVRQGEGFGRHLMQHLERAAVQHGIRTIQLDASLPAKPFYDRIGYVTITAASLPVENGRRLDFFKMQKILRQCVRSPRDLPLRVASSRPQAWAMVPRTGNPPSPSTAGSA
jgi:putative acetyltransferase